MQVKYRIKGIHAITYTALFAAIIFIGISVLRIPIPALVGRPFVHFGNSLTVLAILILGGRRGAIAGAIGLGGFDLLNGYAATSWLTVLEVIIMALVVSGMVHFFHDNDRTSNVVIISVIAGITKIFTSYCSSLITALMYGTTFRAAVVASFLSLPATVINSISTAIIVPILYFSVKNIMYRSVR